MNNTLDVTGSRVGVSTAIDELSDSALAAFLSAVIATDYPAATDLHVTANSVRTVDGFGNDCQSYVVSVTALTLV